VKAYVDGAAGGTLDHGLLTGLADDDHTQYILADGTRSFSDYIDIDESSIPGTPAANVMRLYAESIQGFPFLSFKDDGGMVRKLVRDSIILVYNNSGSTIAANRIVYASGSSADVPTIALAKADAAATMPAIGITIESIADSAFGRVMQVGLLENVNTLAYNPGDIFYVSATTAGVPTTTPPVAPNLRQEIGTVLADSATVGSIQIVARSVFNDGVIDHGALLGLADDDHTQYLLADGTRALAGAWDLGSQNLSNGGTITASSFVGPLTGNADTITVADTADATCYVGLWEDASGSLAGKTDTKITYDAVVGRLTVTRCEIGSMVSSAGNSAALHLEKDSVNDNVLLINTNTPLITINSNIRYGGDYRITFGDGGADDILEFTGFGGTAASLLMNSLAHSNYIDIYMTGTLSQIESWEDLVVRCETGDLTLRDGVPNLVTVAELKDAHNNMVTAIAFNTGDGIITITQEDAGTLTTVSLDGRYYTEAESDAAFQPLDAELTAIAGLTSAANKVPYFTGSETAGLKDIGISDDNLLEVDGSPNSGEYARFTAAGLEGRTEAEFKGDFNLEIGTDVQAFGAVLDDLNTLGASTADGEFLVATGAGTLAWEAGSTARDSLSLGTSDTPQFARLGIGTAAVSTASIKVVDTVLAAAANIMDFDVTLDNDGFTTTVRGMYFQPRITPSNMTDHITVITTAGVAVGAAVTSPGGTGNNLTNTNGIIFSAQYTITKGAGDGAVSCTALKNYLSANPSANGGATIGTAYGFFDAGLTTATTNWGLYMQTPSYIANNATANGIPLYVKQAQAAAAQTVLKLEQLDQDESFIDFVGTSAADQTKSISTVNGDGSVEGPKNYSSSAGWQFEGMLRIEVNGTEYWQPYYSADTS
jgi:hypothetical protein